MRTILQIVTDEMNLAKENIAKSYRDKGLKASGKFENSLEIITTQQGNNIKSTLMGAFHSYFMENGRRPNREQTAKQARSLGKILEQWVKDKGISVNPYAAAWKIVREGIKVPNNHNPGNVISSVVNQQWIDNIERQIRESTILSIKSDMLKQWQQSQ